MASFKAKTGRDRLRMRGKKNYCFDPFKPDPEQGIPKKQQKKFKKLNNIIMASFQAKTGWDKLKVREKNFLVPIQSNPTRNREFQKNSKKMQQIKKHYYGFISTQNGMGLDEIV